MPGVVTFTFNATDGAGAYATGYATITVLPAAPRAAADVFDCPFDSPCLVSAPGLLGNDASDNQNGSLAVITNATAAPAAGGALALAPNGAFNYTPPAWVAACCGLGSGGESVLVWGVGSRPMVVGASARPAARAPTLQTPLLSLMCTVHVF